MSNQITNITYIYCRFHLKVTAPLEFPAFIGNIIRGKIGAALKNNQLCNKNNNDCQICMYQKHCAYFQLYENELTDESTQTRKFLKQPRPYIFKTPMNYKSYYSPGELLFFDLVLIGSGAVYLNEIIKAIKSTEITTSLNLSLDIIEYQQGWENGEKIFGEQLKTSSSINFPLKGNTSELNIKFLSPVRIKEKGAEPKNISPELLLDRILLRLELLSSIYCNGNYLQNTIELPELNYTSKLFRYEQKRKSFSNKKLTNMSGMLGSITIKNNLQTIYPVLKLGELIHIGKYASFGMGQFEVNERARG